MTTRTRTERLGSAKPSSDLTFDPRNPKLTTRAAIQIILQNGREQKQQFKASERSDFNTSRGGAGDNHPGTQRR